MSEEICVASAEHRAGPATSESWLRRHSDLFALAIVAMGFGLRILSAQGRSLIGDEAYYFTLVNLPRALDVYRESLTSAHPPLFFLLLHFWIRLGNSEFFLRLLPVALGGAFLWVAYRWALILLGRSAALMTLVLLSFSPALVSLSAEVRHYTLLLLLMTAALLLLEHAMEKPSPLRVAISSAFLSLAILTHYSAFFVAAAMFVYGLVRLRSGRLPAGVVKTWAACQVGVGALCLWLAATHVGNLRGSVVERGAITRWLRAEYFQPDQDHLFAFMWRQTAALFRFFFGLPALAVLAAAAGGAAYLAAKKRPAALLLALPFFFGMGAALLDLYPFGGTRHSVYLLPFVTAAAGALTGAITAGRLWPAVLAAGILLPLSFWTLPVSRGQDLAGMTAAIGRLRSAAPPGSVLFADDQTSLLLSYYLGREGFTHRTFRPQGYWEDDAAGYRIVGSGAWIFSKAGLPRELDRFVRSYGFRRGQNLWIIQARPDYDPAAVLSRSFAGMTFPFVARPGSLSIVEAKLP